MKQAVFMGALILTALFGIYGVVTVYDSVMTAGRMWETPVVRPHEKPLLVMAQGVVPSGGGEAVYKLQPPVIETGDPLMIKTGSIEYKSFCVHCHGVNLDGQGTVGQSFSPLPRNLTSPEIKAQEDALLFQTISYGLKRMPGLATTLSTDSRLAVIAYIRSQQKVSQ